MDESEGVIGWQMPVFCKRNNIGLSSAYKAHAAGLLELTKVFNKTIVTIEAEAKFRKLAREGKLVWPKKATDLRRPGRRAHVAVGRH
jgi:hypothetical protein